MSFCAQSKANIVDLGGVYETVIAGCLVRLHHKNATHEEAVAYIFKILEYSVKH